MRPNWLRGTSLLAGFSTWRSAGSTQREAVGQLGWGLGIAPSGLKKIRSPIGVALLLLSLMRKPYSTLMSRPLASKRITPPIGIGPGGGGFWELMCTSVLKLM